MTTDMNTAANAIISDLAAKLVSNSKPENAAATAIEKLRKEFPTLSIESAAGALATAAERLMKAERNGQARREWDRAFGGWMMVFSSMTEP